jgi:L-asparaginase II
MPFVSRGGPDKMGFTQPELAVMCGSHNGEDVHVEAVRSILSKIGHKETDLQCGSHVPSHITDSGQRVVGKTDFSPVYNNCSGKHAGMLAFCTLTGTSPENYLDFEHPIQLQIRRAMARFAGLDEKDLMLGVDGCSAPNFAMPLAGLARAFVRLCRDGEDPEYGDAPRIIYHAMTTHPEMVSGEKRNDLAIMQTGRGDWVSKVGAEAMQGIGIRSRRWGIAIKIADGNPRALHPVSVEVLRQIGLLDDPDRTPLGDFRHPPIKNYRQIETGVVRPVFRLNTHGARGATQN